MSTQQSFLAEAATQAAKDLATALSRLPVEKRDWCAGGSARGALDMVAEVAILNGATAETLEKRAFPAGFDYAAYTRDKNELAQDESALQALLEENTTKVAEAIRAVSDEDLGVEVQMPWGPMTLAQIISYPYWNASYHEGQINFIASMLGCLE